MRRRNAHTLITLFLMGALPLVAGAQAAFEHIDNATLKKWLAAGVPLYDVRRADEWRQTGVVAGGRLLTFVDLLGRQNAEFAPGITAEAAKDTPVILICLTGGRTDTLARLLVQQLGYTRVYNVRDGIDHWLREGNAVVRPEDFTSPTTRPLTLR